jgi:tRNA-dihydrouridine synthase 3
LTWYEHKNRVEQSGAFATMTGRGALIKPWIFKEKIDGAEWDPTPEARVGVYLTLCGYFKEHFRADELGKKRYMEFMPWHFGFFCRYRPLPETVYGAMAREHPLLQTRLGVVESAAIAAAEARHLSPLDRLLRVELEECHARLSEALWDADQDVGRAVELFEAMTTDGSLERWEAEERAERARSRDPDASLGAGDTIRG